MKATSKGTMPEKIMRMKTRYSVSGMASLTGKSESWIRQVACHAGISLAEKYTMWTKEMDAQLTSLRLSGASRSEIANSIGCSKNSVRARIDTLRRTGRLI